MEIPWWITEGLSNYWNLLNIHFLQIVGNKIEQKEDSRVSYSKFHNEP